MCTQKNFPLRWSALSLQRFSEDKKENMLASEQKELEGCKSGEWERKKGRNRTGALYRRRLGAEEPAQGEALTLGSRSCMTWKVDTPCAWLRVRHICASLSTCQNLKMEETRRVGKKGMGRSEAFRVPLSIPFGLIRLPLQNAGTVDL